MSKRAQKARKSRLAEPSPAAGSRDPYPSDAKTALESPRGILRTIEHPLILAIILIIGALVGVLFFTPVLAVCEACILLALHGSKILERRGIAVQAAVYGILFLITMPALLGVGIVAKQPARDYFHRLASQTSSTPKSPIASATAQPLPPANPILPPGGFFKFPTGFPTTQPENPAAAATPAANDPTRSPGNDQPPMNGAEAALIQEMRVKLTRDAGDPDKVSADVQWMRQQFESGWSLEPPELANKHRAETEQTARLILANASNRDAILSIIPHISIDAIQK